MPHPLAGTPAPVSLLIDPSKLESDYYQFRPDPATAAHRVSFGTSGHRGTPGACTFNEAHILAITQAICDYRANAGITGPLYLGRDTHAVSAAAERTAFEVLAANGVTVIAQPGPTPTPVVSHAILIHNCGRESGLADGIVITPSHNPPEDGGFKYNPPQGGPADTDITDVVQKQANEYLAQGNQGVRRSAPNAQYADLIGPYVKDLAKVINFDVIRGIPLGVHPLGGSSLPYWEPIAEEYGLTLELVSRDLDPTFGFMTVDHDGKIRMDCSSPYAMASLVALKDRFAIAFASDPDADRHGIVTKSAGLMNPNHYLAVAIDYLLTHRPGWSATAAVGKTLVSSNLIDKAVASHSRALTEVPVGFKWFAPGLYAGSICFGGEESAGASFLRRDGTVWTTDKDGILLCLLAAEITGATGRDPGEHHRRLVERHGESWYTRIDTPATPEQKDRLKRLDPAELQASELAGDPILRKMSRAPGNQASIGGLKVETAHGWFAARPSGTENICKLYAESFRGADHLTQIVEQAQAIIQ
jgi:phosphoglucomutase